MKNLAFLLLLAAFGCHHFRESPSQRRENVAISSLDTTLLRAYPLKCAETVRTFYQDRDFHLFWSFGHTLQTAADSLIHTIGAAHEYGLIPSDYHLDEILELYQDTLAEKRLARIDLLLTDGYFALRSHVRDGRLDPKTLVRRDLSKTVNQGDIELLKTIHDSSLAIQLRSVEPKAAQYHELKNVLKGFHLLGKEDSVQRRRTEQVALNMERWRWQMPFPERYVFVNIPAFTMRVVEKDSVWLQTKVIVGKRSTPTPVMESIIRSFIIYPYWHVPNSIATKEILPDLQGDGSYLRRNNFDVLNKKGIVINADTIQWNLYSPDYFPFILRQREGSENSMGIIKFNFANHYGVYLHDTNTRGLFSRHRRDLSHGCIRVNQAVSFAHYLVRDDDIYVSPDDLDQYLSLQQRLQVDLRRPIPLKLEYFTAEAHEGVATFYDDIYKKDSLMTRALFPLLPQETPANQDAGKISLK